MARKILLILLGVIAIAVIIGAVVLGPRMAQRPMPSVAAEATPTRPIRTGPLTLADVRRIFVRPTLTKTSPPETGFVDMDDPPLRHALAKDEVFIVVTSKEEADAIFGLVEERELRDVVKTYRTGPIARTWAKQTTANAEATLRDAQTDAVLWTSKRTKTVTGAPYYGELSSELVEQLTTDYLKARSTKP